LTKKRRYEEDDDTVFYLKYKSLEDMLKIIIYSSQSMLGTIPMLYHINYNNQQILFMQTGVAVGGGAVTIHYIIQSEKPNKKFIELKRLSGEFSYVDKIGNDSMSLYVPVLELETSTFKFP
jgi:hypothetical protein